MQVRPRWIGLAIGIGSGAVDTILLRGLGVDLVVEGRDLTLYVALYLGATFAALGYVIGHHIEARRRERRDAATIREQMLALEETRRIATQNEKLAAIGRLAAGIAHEVRNPLGVIRASAAMIEEGASLGDEEQRACRFICEEIDRLNGLITSLLAYARPKEACFEAVSLDRVIERAVRLADEALRRQGIEVEWSEPKGVPEIVGDPDLLAQVVLGLLTNAAEAQQDGGRIAVRVEAGAQEVHLEVADAGPGIPDVDSDRVFEPFFTTKPTGTGLGLAMTARIVQRHGGHIDVRQGRGAGDSGRGACVHVALPIGTVAVAQAHA